MQVYLLRLKGTNYFKVGISMNVSNRITNLRGASPLPIELIAVQDQHRAPVVERAIHKALAAHHAQGEWFHCDQEQIESVFHAHNTMAHIDDAMAAIGTEEDAPSSLGRKEDPEPLLIVLRKSGLSRRDARVLLAQYGIHFDNSLWTNAGGQTVFVYNSDHGDMGSCASSTENIDQTDQ